MSLREEVEELVAWMADRPDGAEATSPPVLVTREAWGLVRDGLGRAGDSLALAASAFAAEHPRRLLLAELARDLELECRSLALRASVLGRRAPRREDVPPAPDAPAAPVPTQAEAARAARLEEQRLRQNVERAEARKAEAYLAMDRVAAAVTHAEVAREGFERLDARFATTTDTDLRGRMEEIRALVKGAHDHAALALEALRGTEPTERTGAQHVAAAMGKLETVRGHLTEDVRGDDAAARFAEEVDVVVEMALTLHARAMQTA